MTPALQQKIQEKADKKYPFIWPKNKHGEEIVMRVGQENPPGSRKIKNIQGAFISGATFYHDELAMRWVRAEAIPPAHHKQYILRTIDDTETEMPFTAIWSTITKSFRVEGKYINPAEVEYLYQPTLTDKKENQ